MSENICFRRCYTLIKLVKIFAFAFRLSIDFHYYRKQIPKQIILLGDVEQMISSKLFTFSK